MSAVPDTRIPRWIPSAAAMAVCLGLWAAPAMAQDIARGEEHYNTYCVSCHTLDGTHSVAAPTHTGIFGRQAGSTDFARYSDDMKAAGEAGLVWDDDTMAEYLVDPKAYLAQVLGKDRARTRMAYRGTKDIELSRDVVAYLKTVWE